MGSGLATNIVTSSVLHNVKLSSVVPKSVTGESAVHELTSMDLAMKSHYMRVVYYYSKEDVDGVQIVVLKKTMFDLLDTYCSVAARVRRGEGGRPVMKCNDAGMRIIEGQCSKSLEEWLELGQEAPHKELVPCQILGPVLHFSPLALVQFTWFKCGGMALGFSWAHLLGNAVTAATFINVWGELLAGKPKMKSLFLPRTSVEKPEAKPTTISPSIKKIEIVEERWTVTNKSKMKSTTFAVSPSKLKQILSKNSISQSDSFHTISALVWKCLAKFREAKIVTICRNGDPELKRGMLSNKQIISTVKTEINAGEAEISELAQILSNANEDETKEIEAMVEDEIGTGDYIVYGANLTFVDMQDADFYGLEMKGKKPVHVNFNLDGVGDEGAVLVYKDCGKDDLEGGIRVAVTLLEDQVQQLLTELKRGWGIS